MIHKKHFHILEAVSVLLFSLLASFIFDLKINFKQEVNWVQVGQLVVLTISTFVFYFMVDKLKNIYSEAEKDYMAETDPQEKAGNPIATRYTNKYGKIKSEINTKLTFSIFFAILFFLVEPVIAIL